MDVMRWIVAASAFSLLTLAQVGAAQVTPAAYTVEPFSPSSAITLQGTGVRLRAEPFATPQTQVLSSGSTGLPLTVVGLSRQPDWNWYQVILNNGQKAFIRSDLTSAPSRGGGTTTASAATTSPLPPIPVIRSTVAPPRTTVPATTLPPVYPAPVTTPAPAAASGQASGQPSGDNAPISLAPRSPILEPGAPVAPRSPNPAGLQSTPPQ
jgi:hypothetical protein